MEVTGLNLFEQLEVFTTISEYNSTNNRSTIESNATENIFVIFQVIPTFIGFIANILTMVIFARNTKTFSTVICYLLKHQSLVDASVCGMAIPIILQPHMWTTGVFVFDVFTCHVWHSQVIYWGSLLVSVWNLLLICTERYIAVCKPLHHRKIYAQRNIYIILGGMYSFSAISVISNILEVKFVNGHCYNEPLYNGNHFNQFLHFRVVFYFMEAYAIPCCLFFIFYGMVLVTLKKRHNHPAFRTTTIIEKASYQMTKTMILVTIFFIIFVGFDSWFFLLSTSVLKYIYNSTVQKIGVFMAVLNCCANPFVYASSMPMFRKHLKQTFVQCKTTLLRVGNQNTVTDEENM